jgi:hypothetical protein
VGLHSLRFARCTWPKGCCRSSVVEHPLGKGEVVSSILTGSTTSTPDKTKVFRSIDCL